MLPIPEALVDLDRYPLDHLDGARSMTVVGEGRRSLAERGYVALPGFLRPEAVTALVGEAEALTPMAHRSRVEGTAYLTPPDESFPTGHPRQRLWPTSLGAVAYDRFPFDSGLRALYRWDPLRELIRRLLDEPVLHRYGDPLGALNLAVMVDGDELGWHFDQTDFVVSIALQSSEVGGHFECAELIRTAGDERYDQVAAVMDGDTAGRVRVVAMEPGTLLLFAGRRSLHRVSRVGGDRARHVALLGFDTRAGTRSSAGLQRVRYGRVA